MTVTLKVDPVPIGWFDAGDIISFPNTGEIMRVTGVRRQVIHKLGFGKPRRGPRRQWPRTRYTMKLDIIRGERLT